MKEIKLKNPHYGIKHDLLKKDLPEIKKSKLLRLIRRRVPIFMDGYRYASYAVKKRWGLDIIFIESGHEQVKQLWIDDRLHDDAAKLWLDKIDSDKTFSKNLIKEFLGIIKLEKNIYNTLSKEKIINKDKIQKYILAHLDYWVKFFELAYLWFSIEKIQRNIDDQIKQSWNGKSEDLDFFLMSIYRPMQLPPTSVEQRELLKIVNLKDAEFDRVLQRHWKKYRHLSLHNIDDEYFNLEYYQKRIKALRESKKEYKKEQEQVKVADKEIEIANNLIKDAKLPKRLKDKISLVRWFMYIRTASIDYFMLVNAAYKPVFESLSDLFELPMDAVLHMTYKEILDSLKKGKLSISRSLILDRTKNGYAYLIAPHGSYLVTGKEVDELHSLVIPKEKAKKIKELKGQTAFHGKVSGIARVILDRRNAHELKKGEILVTTMTSPEFVPAMKKSAGIVTNEGGVLCHAAIMARELRKPAVIGTQIATDTIKTGQKITIDADNGVIHLGK